VPTVLICQKCCSAGDPVKLTRIAVQLKAKGDDFRSSPFFVSVDPLTWILHLMVLPVVPEVLALQVLPVVVAVVLLLPFLLPFQPVAAAVAVVAAVHPVVVAVHPVVAEEQRHLLDNLEANPQAIQ